MVLDETPPPPVDVTVDLTAEDFTTYTEYDPSGYLTVATNSITYTDLPADTISKVYKNTPPIGDFDIVFKATCSSQITNGGTNPGEFFVLGLSTDTDMGRYGKTILGIVFQAIGSQYEIWLYDTFTGKTARLIRAKTGTWYFRLKRTGNLATLYIYSDSARTNEVAGSPISITCQEWDLTWVGAGCDGWGTAGNTFAGTLENLNFLYTQSKASLEKTQKPWGEGAPDNTIVIVGWDSTSGIYRRVLVDQIGTIQVDVVATLETVNISGETVKVDPTSLSGHYVRQNPVDVSGQVVRILETLPAIMPSIPDWQENTSGQWVHQNPAEVSGQIVKQFPADLSGQVVKQIPADLSGQVVRILDPAGSSGQRIKLNPNELSGQMVKIFELQKSTGMSTRVVSITDVSGGNCIASAEVNRKALIIQYIATNMSLSENPLQSGQGIRLVSATPVYKTTTYSGPMWAHAETSGGVIIVSSET